MIVPTQVSIDIVPTKDTGALISVCTTGHIDPKSESGKPKLTKQIYMSVNNRIPILKQTSSNTNLLYQKRLLLSKYIFYTLQKAFFAAHIMLQLLKSIGIRMGMNNGSNNTFEQILEF